MLRRPPWNTRADECNGIVCSQLFGAIWSNKLRAHRRGRVGGGVPAHGIRTSACKKRLASPQQPNMYLEPKWLRCLLNLSMPTWASLRARWCMCVCVFVSLSLSPSLSLSACVCVCVIYVCVWVCVCCLGGHTGVYAALRSLSCANERT